ncbi:MAG: hypothetical protein WDN45_01360 [Caulobacteraceae bacterium]
MSLPVDEKALAEAAKGEVDAREVGAVGRQWPGSTPRPTRSMSSRP